MESVGALQQLVPAVAIALIFAVLLFYMSKQNSHASIEIAKESSRMLNQMNQDNTIAHREKVIAFVAETKRKDEALERLVQDYIQKGIIVQGQLSASNHELAGAIDRLNKRIKV